LANTKSAQKAMRQGERRAIRNQSARAAVRTYFKKATEAVTTTVEEATEVVRIAVRALDRAAQKGIVHPNAAARRKSRLMTRLHQLSLAEANPPEAVAAPQTKTRGGTKTAAKRGTSGKATAADKKPATPRATTRKPGAKA
jgi:small subunit ribosomal protein S20